MLRRFCSLAFIVGLLLAATLPQGARAFDPPIVAIQAGHWKTNELPDEFARLRTSTGATAGGVREVDLNVDIAHRIAVYLRSWGNQAYVLPSTVPPTYKADAFVAIHSDGNANRNARGYKVATYWRSWVASDMLARQLDDQYGKDTGLPRDWRVTGNMRGYYPFNSGLYQSTIAADTPAAILEMGFLSNGADRAYMIANRDLIARSIALGIARFLGTRPAGGWPAPPPLPSSDIVEMLHDRTPLYEGPSTSTKIIDRAAIRERYAVAERRDGFAKLFFYSGNVGWVQDFMTKQITLP